MTDAQICHTDDGIYKSKGSLYSDLVVKDDILHITFTGNFIYLDFYRIILFTSYRFFSVSDGSLCTFDSKTVSSQTEMQFKCAPEEKGPVYKGEVNCVGHVLWETPHACPYHVSILIMHRKLEFHETIDEVDYKIVYIIFVSQFDYFKNKCLNIKKSQLDSLKNNFLIPKKEHVYKGGTSFVGNTTCLLLSCGCCDNAQEMLKLKS